RSAPAMATVLSRRLGKRSLLGTRVAAPDGILAPSQIAELAPHGDGSGSRAPEESGRASAFPNPGLLQLRGQQELPVGFPKLILDFSCPSQVLLNSLDEPSREFPPCWRVQDVLQPQALPHSMNPEVLQRSVSSSIDVPKRSADAAVEMDEMVAAMVLTSLSCSPALRSPVVGVPGLALSPGCPLSQGFVSLSYPCPLAQGFVSLSPGVPCCPLLSPAPSFPGLGTRPHPADPIPASGMLPRPRGSPAPGIWEYRAATLLPHPPVGNQGTSHPRERRGISGKRLEMGEKNPDLGIWGAGAKEPPCPHRGRRSPCGSDRRFPWEWGNGGWVPALIPMPFPPCQALPSIQIPVSPHIFTSISWAAAASSLPALSPVRSRSLSLSDPQPPPLRPPPLVASPPRASLGTRKARGEAKKCRKVYGIEHREQWCTACRWKKACQRFLD
ncbi:ZN395 protein, partial [Erpornis zantholeuca]|nr:ZN395 protein [Erpornis zantholeuca]